jgi:hypothetical protein
LRRAAYHNQGTSPSALCAAIRRPEPLETPSPVIARRARGALDPLGLSFAAGSDIRRVDQKFGQKSARSGLRLHQKIPQAAA